MNINSKGSVAHIYARQSEDVGIGIARQLARCRQLIAAKGWTLGREFTDNDVSAAAERGPGTAWAAMLEAVQPGEIIVSVDIDRLLRNMRDMLAITDTGAKVLTVDGEIDLTTADGEFRATMLTGIARFEIRRKSERQRRANEDKRAKGLPTPGRRRYGYESDGVTPRESEAVIVRRVFDHLASGGSVRSMALALTAEGVDPGGGRGWPVNRVRDMATNPRYSGQTPFGGELIQSPTIVPLVDPELGEAVRALMADPTRRTSPGTAYRHLLSGVVCCNLCGSSMYYMRAYLCKRDLNHVSIRKEILEPYVLDELAKAFIVGGPDMFPEHPGTASVAVLIKSHRRNAEAVADTLADRDADLIPATVARARLVELKTERDAIEAELEASRSNKSAAAALLEVAQDLIVREAVTMAEFDAMKASVLERFAALDIERQRLIVQAVLHIEVAKGRDVAKRVFITHKLVPSLNPDFVTEDFDAE